MKVQMLLAPIIAGALLCGCAGGPGYGFGYTHDVAYDGFYDDYYGPVYDGYWKGNDFYWRDREGSSWRHDADHHFRRDSAPGFHHIAGAMHRGGGHPPK